MVTRLIEKFENHQHKESFLQDLSQTQKIDKFSKESQDLIAEMNNTEIFELCEKSSRKQYPECNTYWEIGIIYCSRGRNMKNSERPTEFEQNNYDVTSIPSLAVLSRRTAVVVPSTDLLNDNNTCTMARQRNVQDFVVTDRVERKDTMHDDRIALEKHICIATRAERIQNSKHWILTLNAEGPQEPLNQRPDFAQATRECKRLHDEHLARTQQDYRTIPRSQQVRQRKEQQFEGIEEYDYAVDPQTGWRFCKESRGNLSAASSPSSNWDRTTGRRAVRILSILQGLTICVKKFLRVRTCFGCLENNLQTTDGRCEQYTHKYSTYRVAQHDHISSREHAWLKSWQAQDCTSLCPKTFVVHVSCPIPCRT